MTTTQTTRKPVLTATARTALGDALKDGNRHILNMNAPGWTKVVEELEPLGMITVTRSLRYGGAQSWELTPAGMAVRSVVLRNRRVSALADAMRKEQVDGEDLVTIAASIDARETDYVGPGDREFYTMFALAASIEGCSAEDFRTEFEHYMGW